MFNFGEILSRMLRIVADTFDKRQGSIIYDTLAPVSVELAEGHIQVEIFKQQTYLMTATGDNLDRRAADFSIARFQATQALRIAEMFDQNDQLVDIEIGTRFASPSATGGIIFVAVERQSIGRYIMRCESFGTIGNEYYGDILPLFISNNLGRSAIIDTFVPAENQETDYSFRARVIEYISQKAFGGNVADYRKFVIALDGVADVKVFPVWDGGGTVMISIVDDDYNSVTDTFIDEVKRIVDPVEDEGRGIGTAPIGHTVTVVTPTPFTINVEAKVMLSGSTIGQIQEEAEKNINDYLFSVRQDWGTQKTINIFSLLIANAILKVTGVINVPEIKLNGKVGDILLIETPQLQQLPYLGTVVLSEY